MRNMTGSLGRMLPLSSVTHTTHPAGLLQAAEKGPTIGVNAPFASYDKFTASASMTSSTSLSLGKDFLNSSNLGMERETLGMKYHSWKR